MLKQRFDYETGGFKNVPKTTPAKWFLIGSDYNISNSNQVSYKALQFQDNFTKYGVRHLWIFGTYVEECHSDNSCFGCCPQGAWSYNSLQGFYRRFAGGQTPCGTLSGFRRRI